MQAALICGGMVQSLMPWTSSAEKRAPVLFCMYLQVSAECSGRLNAPVAMIKLLD
jgi:hypothetical protein